VSKGCFQRKTAVLVWGLGSISLWAFLFVLNEGSFFQAGMRVSEMMERLGVVIWQLVTLLDFEIKYAFFNPEVSILALE
jgi:hypothetical protein